MMIMQEQELWAAMYIDDDYSTKSIFLDLYPQVKSYEWNSIAHTSVQDKIEMLQEKIFGLKTESDINAPYR